MCVDLPVRLIHEVTSAWTHLCRELDERHTNTSHHVCACQLNRDSLYGGWIFREHLTAGFNHSVEI